MFEQSIGDVKIMEDGYVVVHDINTGEVRGKQEYTSGIHRLRFRIEKESCSSIFIGIISKSAPIQRNTLASPSSYGWITENHYYTGGARTKTGDVLFTYSDRENDTIELLINVTTRTLRYTNERTKQPQQMKININKCSLPWQLLINLSGPEDRLRLLDYTNLS